MRKTLFTIIICIILLAISTVPATASSDGHYSATELSTYAWEGTAADRTATRTPGSYDYRYGDEQIVAFSLPWQFTFYGQPYSQISADTNGNIWFTNSTPAHSFSLANTGRGSVISAWNNDLNSTFIGGVFVQRKTCTTTQPAKDCVVVQWQTETYDDTGYGKVNNFEAILFASGDIRLDYNKFDQSTNKDFGSGVSNGSTSSVNLTTASGGVYKWANHSIQLASIAGMVNTLSLRFTGSGGCLVYTNPIGLACNADCSAQFPTASQVTLLPSPTTGYILTGWSAPCSGTGNCTVTMNSDVTVTATFGFDPAQAVYITGTGNNAGSYYQSLQAAYDVAVDATILKIRAMEISEDLNSNQSKTVVLQGGYGVDYLDISSGESVLNGSLTVTNGLLIVDGLTLR